MLRQYCRLGCARHRIVEITYRLQQSVLSFCRNYTVLMFDCGVWTDRSRVAGRAACMYGACHVGLLHTPHGPYVLSLAIIVLKLSLTTATTAAAQSGSTSCAPADIAQELLLQKLLGSSARHHLDGAGRPLSASAHARTTQDPVRSCHGSLLPAVLGLHCSNTHQSLQLSRSAMISSLTVSACC